MHDVFGSVLHNVPTFIWFCVPKMYDARWLVSLRYLDPIYFGDYPESMRQRLGSDLPTFSETDKEFIRNKIDFVGLNHYTSRFIAHHQNPKDIYFYQVQQVERLGTPCRCSLPELSLINIRCIHDHACKLVFIIILTFVLFAEKWNSGEKIGERVRTQN